MRKDRRWWHRLALPYTVPLGIAFVAAVTVTAIIAGNLAWRATDPFRDDLGWVDSRRLKLPAYEVPPAPADNAFDSYLAAGEMMAQEFPGRLQPPWSEATHNSDMDAWLAYEDQVRAYVQRHQDALSLLQGAADKACVTPLARPDPYAMLPYSASIRRIIYLAADAAWVALRDGDASRALDLVEGLTALGTGLAAGGGARGDILMANLAVSLAHRRGLSVMTTGHPSPARLRRHAARIAELRKRWPPPWRLALWYGHEGLQHLDSIRQHGLRDEDLDRTESWAPIQPRWEERAALGLSLRHYPQTRAWLEDRYARAVEELRRPLWLVDAEEFDSAVESDVIARQDYLLCDVEEPGVGGWVVSTCRIIATLTATEVIACLEAYRAEHGRYPESLAQLVPDYLPELPTDPWTGEPMPYRLAGDSYTLYAAGPNKRDDGGVWDRKEGRPLEPDQVFVPPPWLKAGR